MPNRPEYLAIWLGITRVGGVVALLNTNLDRHRRSRIASTSSSRSTSSSPPSCSARFATAQPHAQRQRRRSGSHGDDGARLSAPRPRGRQLCRRHARRDRAAPRSPSRTARSTSTRRGTTGLPKAANINHYRVMLAMPRLRRRDGHARRPTACTTACRCITPPAACCATGALLIDGGSVVIREKILRARVLGRRRALRLHALPLYRRALPLSRQRAAASERDASTSIRLACGNGLRPDIWDGVQDALPHPADPRILRRDRRQRDASSISTASPARSAACRGSSRTASRSRWCASTSSSEQPVRDADGFCIECEPDEIGEVIGKIINDPTKPGNRFEGYADKAADRKEDPARRVREGRRLVPHRRPDAPGRARLFLFRRPHRRHLPLEGRERLDLGSRRGDQHASPASRKPMSTACRCPAATAAPAWRRSSCDERPAT